MKLFQLLLIPVLLFTVISFTGCNEEPVNSIPQEKTQKLPKLILPAGAVITNATFNIFVEDATNNGIDVHKVNVPWAEATETWNIFYGKSAPQFDATVLGSFNSTYGWQSVNITSLVQSWIANPTTNNGVLLNQPLNGSGISVLRSKEYNGGGVSDPYLEVTYTVGSGSPITVQEPAFQDTYIWSIQPDDNFGNDQYLRVARIDNYVKQALIKFDIEGTPVQNCETAYAFGDTPFCGLPNIGNWGWTEYINGNYTNTNIPIYAGAAQCDPSKGIRIGTLSITYVGTNLTVNYTMNPGVTVNKVHMWIGNTPLPVKNNKLTSAPGQFNYNNKSFPFNLTRSNPFYIAVHFDACW